MEISKLQVFHENGKYCDVNLQVQEKLFTCHRVILASASEYFDTLLGGKFVESYTQTVTLHDIDVLTFEVILKYIYGIENEPQKIINENNVLSILCASDFFKIDALEQYCINFLQSRVHYMDDVIQVLNLACSINKTLLIDILVKHIIKNFSLYSKNDVLKEISYVSLRMLIKHYHSPLKVLESNYGGEAALFIDENTILDLVIRWVILDYKSRCTYFSKLLDHVNFHKISSHYAAALMKTYRIKNFDSNRPDVGNFEKMLREFMLNQKNFIGNSKYSGSGNFKRLFLEHVLRQTSPCQEFFHQQNKLALHFFVEVIDSKRRRGIFSINKYEPRNSYFSFPNLQEDNTCIGLRYLKLDNSDNLYCLEIPSQFLSTNPFYKYPSILESHTDKFPLTSPPLYMEFFDICSLQNKIYLYHSNIHHIESYLLDKAYALSKNFSTQQLHRGIYHYCPDLDEWYPVPEMKKKLAESCMTADGNLVYVIGGTGKYIDERVEKGFVQAHDSRTQQWLTLPTTKNSYCNAKSCSLNGKIYVSNLWNTEVYDPVAGKWEIIDRHPDLQKMYGHKNSFIKRRYKDLKILSLGNHILLLFEHFYPRIEERISRGCCLRIVEPTLTFYDTVSKEWCTLMSLDYRMRSKIMPIDRTSFPQMFVKDVIVESIY